MSNRVTVTLWVAFCVALDLIAGHTAAPVLVLLVIAQAGGFLFGARLNRKAASEVKPPDHIYRLAYRLAEQVEAVEALIEHARKVSPSDRMTVYVGDLLHALGLADEKARTRTGGNG